MSRTVALRLLILCSLGAALLTGCTRDPNVRKQKYFDSGEKYFAQGKYREALLQYSNALQIDSRFAQAEYQLSQTYLRLSDPQRAYQALNRTVELAPDNYRAHTDLANLLLSGRNPDGSPIQSNLKEAKTHLDLLRDKAPNNPETHEAWANYYAAQNNIGLAMQEAQQTITLDPSRSESYLLLALFQLRAGEFDQAENNFKTATTKDPKSINAELALGGFYQTRNRMPEAEAAFRQAIDLDKNSAAPRTALVVLFMQEGKKDQAEAFLKQTKKELADNPEAYHMLGDFYFKNGELDKALAEYSSLYHDHPKNILVKKNYVSLLILKARLDEAGKLDDEILKSSPHDVDALVYKGQIQIQQNDNTGAVETLKSALNHDANSPYAHYQLGLAYSQQRDYTRAEQEWQDAVRLRPEMTDALRSLATLAKARGDLDGLSRYAQQIITAQPQAADGYLLKGFADISHQPPQIDQAQHDAEEALKRAPQSPAPYVQLGNVQMAQKHFSEAEKFYQQALEKDPSSSDGLFSLMHLYAYQKNYDKAIAAANAQIVKSPKNSSFYELLAVALLEGKNDYAGAESNLRKALELDKNNVDAIEKLGKVLVQEKQPDQALALYTQAAKDHPSEVRFTILSGELYESKQNWDQAQAMYQQALNVSPDNPLASNNLAFLILQHGGNIDVALNLAQTARRGMSNSPNAADTLGWAYYKKGIYQSAITQFQEAIRMNEKNGGTDDAEFHVHLGLAYQGANQLSLARQQFEKAVKLSPENAEARKALAELRS